MTCINTVSTTTIDGVVFNIPQAIVDALANPDFLTWFESEVQRNLDENNTSFSFQGIVFMPDGDTGEYCVGSQHDATKLTTWFAATPGASRPAISICGEVDVKVISSCLDPVYTSICNWADMPVGIEAALAPVGCTFDAGGVLTGSVFLCKIVDEATSAVTGTELVHIDTNGTLTQGWTGEWAVCEGDKLDTELTQVPICIDGKDGLAFYDRKTEADTGDETQPPTVIGYIDNDGVYTAGALPAGATVGACKATQEITGEDCDEAPVTEEGFFVKHIGVIKAKLCTLIDEETLHFEICVNGETQQVVASKQTEMTDGTEVQPWKITNIITTAGIVAATALPTGATIGACSMLSEIEGEECNGDAITEDGLFVKHIGIVKAAICSLIDTSTAQMEYCLNGNTEHLLLKRQDEMVDGTEVSTWEITHKVNSTGIITPATALPAGAVMGACTLLQEIEAEDCNGDALSELGVFVKHLGVIEAKLCTLIDNETISINFCDAGVAKTAILEKTTEMTTGAQLDAWAVTQIVDGASITAATAFPAGSTIGPCPEVPTIIEGEDCDGTVLTEEGINVKHLGVIDAKLCTLTDTSTAELPYCLDGEAGYVLLKRQDEMVDGTETAAWAITTDVAPDGTMTAATALPTGATIGACKCTIKTIHELVGVPGVIKKTWLDTAIEGAGEVPTLDIFSETDAEGLPAHPNLPDGDVVVPTFDINTTQVGSSHQSYYESYIYLPTSGYIRDNDTTAERGVVFIGKCCGAMEQVGDEWSIATPRKWNNGDGYLLKAGIHRVRVYLHDNAGTNAGFDLEFSEDGVAWANNPYNFVKPPEWVCRDVELCNGVYKELDGTVITLSDTLKTCPVTCTPATALPEKEKCSKVMVIRLDGNQTFASTAREEGLAHTSADVGNTFTIGAGSAFPEYYSYTTQWLGDSEQNAQLDWNGLGYRAGYGSGSAGYQHASLPELDYHGLTQTTEIVLFANPGAYVEYRFRIPC